MHVHIYMYVYNGKTSEINLLTSERKAARNTFHSLHSFLTYFICGLL